MQPLQVETRVLVFDGFCGQCLAGHLAEKKVDENKTPTTSYDEIGRMFHFGRQKMALQDGSEVGHRGDPS